MTYFHDRASGPPRAQFDRALGEPETELQATAREILTELGYVWLGDLSGWEIVPVVRDTPDGDPLRLELRHRCGRRVEQSADGITGDGASFLANLVTNCMEENDGHTCTPHEPSPEHRARVARWMAAAGLTPSGDVAQDQLALVRSMVSKGPRVVDGPGCTPAVVANEVGDDVPAGSLYADKCAECTTGVSCEDARRCLFEG